MNDSFINIKVDREEHVDVDSKYMVCDGALHNSLLCRPPQAPAAGR